MKIVGVGAGGNLLTAEAIDTIENASVVYGSKRAIELAKDHIRCDCREIEDYKRISELPDGAVVLSTGDPMLSGLGRFAKADDTIVPGISSMQIVSARLKIEQTELAAVTAHARDINRAKEMILSELELGKTVFVLPDARFDLQEVSKFLLDHGFSIPVAVCEQIAYPDERIEIGTTENPPTVRADLFSVVIGSAINRGDRKMSAILSTSSGFSSLPSILTMSFFRSETFMTTLTTSSGRSMIPRMRSTLSACPAVMWSITVPFVILLTRSSRSLCSSGFGFIPSPSKGSPCAQERRRTTV
jgi:cobalt-precorrin-7 (C5)-methyltransferase